MADRTTSPNGISFLKRHEGRVLRAYRCPAGVWTIGDGLTAASGVVDPGPGMVITEAEADRLLTEALRRRYEPAARQAMPGAAQHAFDGGVSFHFNTGAIARASWVPAWIAGDMAAMRERLLRWTKGGGRVLPGLIRRREAEADLIEFGDYGYRGDLGPADDFRFYEGRQSLSQESAFARVTLDLSVEEIAAARSLFDALGYPPGDDPRRISAEAVRAFQTDHGLTVDAILGRATLSTLQRRADARTGAVTGGAISATGGAATLADPLPDVPLIGWADVVVLGLGLALLAWLAWHYRDVVAAKFQSRLPRVAAILRSIK